MGNLGAAKKFSTCPVDIYFIWDALDSFCSKTHRHSRIRGGHLERTPVFAKGKHRGLVSRQAGRQAGTTTHSMHDGSCWRETSQRSCGADSVATKQAYDEERRGCVLSQSYKGHEPLQHLTRMSIESLCHRGSRRKYSSTSVGAGTGSAITTLLERDSLLRHYTLTVVSRSGSLSIKLRIYSCI